MNTQKTVVLVILLIMAGFIVANVVDFNQPIELDGVEISEYQGQNLSSIQDFHENSIKGPQYINIDSYQLVIDGLVANELAYSYQDIINKFQHYKKIVTLNCVEGWSVDILWEGLLLGEIIKDALVQQDANTIVFHAYDGYTSSLPLEYVTDNDILLAFKMNEVVLPPERGYPFQLVAESKWGYKWVKWITRIEISDDPNYRGYWESRGYSNDADVGREFFD
jgi:DMSO/TMAO reductase YedYZ molybdopterin-dependent catalytic subunit